MPTQTFQIDAAPKRVQPVPFDAPTVQTGLIALKRADLTDLLALSGSAVKAYLALSARTHWGRSKADYGHAVLDTDTRQAIADATRLGSRAVRKAVAELQGAGFLEMTDRPARGRHAAVYRLPRFRGAGRDRVPGWVGLVTALLKSGTSVPQSGDEHPARSESGPPSGTDVPHYAEQRCRIGPVSSPVTTADADNILHSKGDLEEDPTNDPRTQGTPRARSDRRAGRVFEKPCRTKTRTPCTRLHAPGFECNALAKRLLESDYTGHFDPLLADRLVHVALARQFGGREDVAGMVGEYVRTQPFDPAMAKRAKPDEADLLRWLQHRLQGIAQDRGDDARAIAERITRPLEDLARQYRADSVPAVPPGPVDDARGDDDQDHVQGEHADTVNACIERVRAMFSPDRPTPPQDRRHIERTARVADLRERIERIDRLSSTYVTTDPRRLQWAQKRADLVHELAGLEDQDHDQDQDEADALITATA